LENPDEYCPANDPTNNIDDTGTRSCVPAEDQQVDWFELIDGQYQPQTPDDGGRLSSKLFPGLWLDTVALLAGDLAKLFVGVDEGTATAEHQEFVKKIGGAAGIGVFGLWQLRVCLVLRGNTAKLLPTSAPVGSGRRGVSTFCRRLCWRHLRSFRTS